MKKNQNGTTIAVAVIIILVLGIVIASVTSIVAAQRRIGIHRELALIANNTAETALDYAYSYVMKDIRIYSLSGASSVPKTGYKTFSFPTSASNLLNTLPGAPGGYTGNVSNISASNIQVNVLAPVVLGRYQIDDKAQQDYNSTLKDQWVTESVIPIVAQVTTTWNNQSYTAYMRKSISLKSVALFQHAIFYQGSLMLHRGYPDLGAIHTNGNLAINAHNDDTANYTGQVTAAMMFYRGSSFDQGGSGDGPYAYNPIKKGGFWDYSKINFVITGYSQISINNNTAMQVLDTTATGPTDETKNTGSLTAGWPTIAKPFNGNLADQAMSVPVVTPVGSTGYAQDDPTQTTADTFNNGPYSLIEPLLPANNPLRLLDNTNNLEANASLVLRIESIAPGGYPIASGASYGTVTATSWQIPSGHSFGEYFVVKAYINPSTNWVTANPTSGMTPVSLPMEVIGQADDTMLNPVSSDPANTAVFTTAPTVTSSTLYYRANRILGSKVGTYGTGYGNGALNGTSYDVTSTTLPNANGDGTFESYAYNASGGTAKLNTNTSPYVNAYSAANNTVALGLHDPRLGRGVNLLTIDVGKLKAIMEANPSTFSTTTAAGRAARAFRDTFAIKNVAANMTATNWNGVIYVEFPTSLIVAAGTPQSPTATDTANPTYNHCGATDNITSYPFIYPTVGELRHPDRMGDSEDAAGTYTNQPIYPANKRTDNIVPIAPQLRGYPSSFTDADLQNPKWAIPALQIINGKSLPYPPEGVGFTIATNAPIYLVGSYNSDGNLASSTLNLMSTSPTAYAQVDTTTSTFGPEVPAALFSDQLTILSDNWETNRPNSFSGYSGGSTSGRTVTAGGVEISAGIATGEYPIFEFMLHALESWQTYYGGSSATNRNPIVIKGSVCGMFHSEIQHIKQAYGRDKTLDIQNFYTGHGAFAIPAVRFSQNLENGIFPPGTPVSDVFSQRDFRLLRTGNSDDAATITGAGFTIQSGDNY